MAKIKITIEDLEGGGVECICTPSVEELLKKHNNTEDGLSSAEAYAVFVLNKLRDASKDQEALKDGILIPGYLRPKSRFRL